MPNINPPHPLKEIVICGANLPGAMCATALARALPDRIKITLLDVDGAYKTDVFYGTVTTPAIYNFLLNLGISEPDLLPQTNTSFSLGTHYKEWGYKKRSWTQSFHTPLPIFEGVEFHHYLTRILGSFPELGRLEDYIMSVHAAKKKVFAHPPSDNKTPLSNVEYGYHFLPKKWREFFLKKISATPIKFIKANIKAVQWSGSQISSLELSNEKQVQGDLFIDCLGLSSPLQHDPPSSWNGKRELTAIESFSTSKPLDGTCRELSASDFGWVAKSPMQDGEHSLTVYDATSEKNAPKFDETHSAPVTSTIGYREDPWQNNHLAFGHSAAILEPMSPAPMILLQRDITRLAELVPICMNMSVERLEYNRRFKEDYEHATAFQRNFFGCSGKDERPYWAAAMSEAVSVKLETKITQFESRGTIVQFDLEPFEKEDWVQQHLGIGRKPKRYDRLAENVSEAQLVKTLRSIQGANAAMASKLPNHRSYMEKLLQYLRKRNE